jgi:hypothetical protein
MTVIQISAVHSGDPGGYVIYGLGDDNKVYIWRHGAWAIA